MGKIAEAIESAEQLVGMWTALVEDYGSATTIDDGIVRCWADADYDFYNTLTFVDADVSLDDMAQRLHVAASFIWQRGKPGYLWMFRDLLTEQADAELLDAAQEAGLVVATPSWGMAGDIPDMAPPTHPDLRFERVATNAHLAAYAGLNARAYGSPENVAKRAFTGSRLWRNDIHAYIGYRGDEAVCCAGTLPVSGKLFVVLVATDPGYQRRGYGEAVTRKAMYEGQRASGLTRMTLQATAAGRPVYERIGLTAGSEVLIFGLA